MDWDVGFRVKVPWLPFALKGNLSVISRRLLPNVLLFEKCKGKYSVLSI